MTATLYKMYVAEFTCTSGYALLGLLQPLTLVTRPLWLLRCHSRDATRTRRRSTFGFSGLPQGTLPSCMPHTVTHLALVPRTGWWLQNCLCMVNSMLMYVPKMPPTPTPPHLQERSSVLFPDCMGPGGSSLATMHMHS